MIRSILLALCVTLGLGVRALEAQDKFLGKTADGWAGQLKSHADAKQRRAAAFALGKMPNRPASAVAAMKDAYEAEKNVKVREAIIFGLGEIARDTKTNAELEPLFLAAIKDQDAYLRRSAAFALGCAATKSDATRAALEKALGDPEAMVRQNAAYALAQFKEDALPLLKKALGDADSLVKRDAASVLVPPTMTDGDKVHNLLDDLLPLCRDTNSETRRAALNVLVQIVDPGDTKAIDALRWALDDRDIDNKRSAAMALSKIGGKGTEVAVPVLLDAAKNSDAKERRQAILAIRNIGSSASSAVPELIRYLKSDSEPKVREAAAITLAGLGPAAEPAVAALVEKIGDLNEKAIEVRIESGMALPKVGSTESTRKVIPTLLDILGDPRHDGRVREKIMWCLKVHGSLLNKTTGVKETLSKVCKESVTVENRMLRYDCAYVLGMIWQIQAPDHTLDVLSEFLKDDSIKIYVGVTVKGGGLGTLEGPKSGKDDVKVTGKGDGRVMATDALKMMGPARYAQRPDIMNELRRLAKDAKTYEPLQKKSAELLEMAK